MIFSLEEGSGFSAFALYNAIKLHFTTDSYDYFKYHGKTNVTRDNFAIRKDKYTFYTIILSITVRPTLPEITLPSGKISTHSTSYPVNTNWMT